jgi:hypothetical protein
VRLASLDYECARAQVPATPHTQKSQLFRSVRVPHMDSPLRGASGWVSRSSESASAQRLVRGRLRGDSLGVEGVALPTHEEFDLDRDSAARSAERALQRGSCRRARSRDSERRPS